MPIVRVEMLAGRDAETKQRIASEITETLARHAGSDPAHVYVMFDDVAHADWAVGGRFFTPPTAPAGG
jgi:4-oxalocrotonate tautomerase